MQSKQKYVYDCKFQRNILVKEKAGCGKTACVQKQAQNKLFRDLKKNTMDISNRLI